ncbi:DUF6090 family protein [Maribacter arcticus]|uniref:DUF6090 family protein n=1 Tax=Maribacter arcticus TaxID=561365 RepID=UPI0030039C67
MIKFFRRIRQQLLTENKFSKYLLYAIGEIILVVIGILIALSINNWNENTKILNLEQVFLVDLKEDLNRNKELLKEDILENTISISSMELLLKNLKNKNIYHDSLKVHFHRARLFPDPDLSHSSYEELKNKGFDLIQSKKLRKKIVDLFEISFGNMIATLNRIENSLRPPFQVHQNNNFETTELGYLSPNNYKLLQSDQVYFNILSQRITFNGRSISMKSQCISKIEEVIKLIDEELK